MKTIFIGGTDTGIGKTVVTGLLAKHLKDQGKKVITQKWVQTGYKDKDNDILTHLKIMDVDKKIFTQNKDLLMPNRYKLPASPHLAASLEKRPVSIAKIKSSLKKLQKEYDYVLVEGVGGMNVPLTKKLLLIDLVKELNLPIILVSANKLGTINTTLQTIESIKSRSIKLLGVIYNNIEKQEKKLIKEDNPKIISKISKTKTFFVLKHNQMNLCRDGSVARLRGWG